MKTKSFNLEEAQAGAPFIVYHNQPARYVGTWHNTRYPHVIEYGHRITEGEGSLTLCAIDAEGNTSAGQCHMIVPEPVYPDWIIQAAKHNQMPWVAQDKDGEIWIYEEEPEVDGDSFMQNCQSLIVVVSRSYAQIKIGCDWKDSLIKVEL